MKTSLEHLRECAKVYEAFEKVYLAHRITEATDEIDRLQAENERLRKEHDDLLTKALGVEAERDIARDDNERLRAALKELVDKCSNNDENGHWSCWDDAREALGKSDTSGKEHG